MLSYVIFLSTLVFLASGTILLFNHIMFLITLMCIFSFACLVISLLALGIVLKSTDNKSETAQIETAANELILLTGCDSGIGLELAKHIHASTKYTIMCGILNMSPDASDGYEQLQKLAESDSEQRLILKKLNITSDEDVMAVKESIDELKRSKRIKRVAALINNSGVMTYGEFDWLTWTHIQSQIDVNLVGTLRLTRIIVPYIVESKGRIINISSVNDATVFPGLSVYSATKSALSTFSQGLGYELRKFGVHVITIRLGDFARLTNILSSHAANRDEMWRAMDWKKKSLYGEFFHQFHDHLLQNYGMTSPKRFVDSNLFDDLSLALLSKKPPNSITCAPWPFRVFYFVIELLPIWIRYHMLDILIQFGFKWRPSSQLSKDGGSVVSSSAPVASPEEASKSS
uniref:D-beta-hydroxybutyrate dehydrogenase, mitochondrial n=1 Tax=Aceria tosichella TaxID=561515 RepID=A0A6G1SFQ4_9ACAR